MNILSVAKAAPKTTVAGILVFVSMLATQISTLFDTATTTNPDWGLIIAGLLALLGFSAMKDSTTGIRSMSLDGVSRLTKPTLYGVLIFVSVLAAQLVYGFDTDPATTVNWVVIATAVLTMVGLASASESSIKVFSVEASAMSNTKIYGILSFLSVTLSQVLYLFDDVTTTNPDWGVIVVSLLALLGFSSAKSAE